MKVALVTGAASGIGKATALAFARKGMHVVISDVDAEGVETTGREIRETGSDPLVLEIDVSDQTQVRHMINRTAEHFGRLDFACNNAGIEGAQAFTTDCTTENWNRVIGVNLSGVWYCMKYEIQLMQKRGAGAIVNMSSIAGLVGFQGIPAYVASKHGILGLTKAAALEYAAAGIRVNAICPGAIETPMIHRFTSDDETATADLVANHPLGRMGTPEEIANAVVWLCLDEASFVTGQALAVDGGFTVH